MRKKGGDKKSAQHCVKLTLIIVFSRVTDFSLKFGFQVNQLLLKLAIFQ